MEKVVRDIAVSVDLNAPRMGPWALKLQHIIRGGESDWIRFVKLCIEMSCLEETQIEQSEMKLWDEDRDDILYFQRSSEYF